MIGFTYGSACENKLKLIAMIMEVFVIYNYEI